MNFLVIAVALTAIVIWGASPVAAKIAVADLSPMAVAALRTVLGGLLALPVALLMGIPLPDGSRRKGLLVLSGFCGFVGFPVIFTFGVGMTSANHASMILACLPVFTGAIALAWDRRWPKKIWWAGCAVALAGEALLVFSRPETTLDGSSVAGDLVVLSSNVFASLGYVAGARLQREGYPSTGTTFWGATLFAIILLPVAVFGYADEFPVLASPRPAIAILYLAVGVTIIGYVMWYWALGRGGIERIGLIQFLQPVSGVVLAFLLLSERVDAVFLVASITILAGVWIAMRAK